MTCSLNATGNDGLPVILQEMGQETFLDSDCQIATAEVFWELLIRVIFVISAFC